MLAHAVSVNVKPMFLAILLVNYTVNYVVVPTVVSMTANIVRRPSQDVNYCEREIAPIDNICSSVSVKYFLLNAIASSQLALF
jgi:hypothetical protein